MAQTLPALWVVAALTVVSGPRALADDSSISPAPPAAVSDHAQPMFGAIAGVVRSSAKAPISGAMVTAARSDGKGIWTTISGTDGIYSIPNIAPGEYQVTTQAEGYPDATAATLIVTAGKATRTDIAMAGGDPQERVVISANTPSPDVPAPSTALPAGNASQSVWRRLFGKSPTEPPVNTAGLIPPSTAFDRPVADAGATPFPGPQGPAAPAPQGSAPQGSAPTPAPEVDLLTPFADYDWTWLNGNPRNHDVAFDSKFFTPEIRADLTYTYDFNKPSDDSMGGSSELFRSNEIQLEQLGIGGDFHWDNVRARFMTQFGEYSEATIRNDGSYNKGQWSLNDADRYLAEAYGGYHINWMKGMNIDAGIFMSYVGLFSYYNFDNWAYQPSYVSSNTPWFFEGIRIQIFPTHHLKIEPWIINGWQSYASANTRKGLGGQIKYTPYPWLNIISNNYGLGHDDLYIPNRSRIHTDNSIEIKYYDKPGKLLDKMAVSVTGDMGCEFGGGVSCYTDKKGGPKQSFIGYMVYNRMWFHKDMFGLTIGGGQINNPGRYLVLIPPINGETAGSAALNSPYFTFNPGDPFKAWDTSVTFDYMPRQWVTFRFEGDYRHANVPYWSGAGGVTPPPFAGGAPGTNNGFPQNYACMNGANSGAETLGAAQAGCASNGGVWFPDLRKDEVLFDIDLMVKF
jgi:Putative beta-barrel porin-2, OmpL-like. bbp2/Carboxypeptidase regulatory-like domain